MINSGQPGNPVDTEAESAQAEAYRQAAAAGQADEAAASPAPTAPGDSPAKRRLNWKVAALAVTLVLLIAGGTAAYFLVYLSPERVLYRAADKLASARSLHFEGAVDVKQAGTDSKNPAAERIDATVKYSGDYDGRETDSPKASLKLGVGGTLGSVGQGDAELEFRYLRKTIYGAMTKAPQNKMLNLKPFENFWISFDTAKEKDSDGKTVDDYLKPLTEDEIKKIKDVLKQHPLVKEIKPQKDDQIGGEPARHYRLKIDYDNLQEFYQAIAPIVARRDLTAEERKSLRGDIPTPKRNDPIDVWVSKRDGTIRKVKSHDEISGEDAGGMRFVSDSTLTITKYDEPMSVSAPKQSLTFKQLEREAEADGDRDGLVDLAERYFETDPKRQDSDGDGHKDGAEVQRGYDPSGPGRLPKEDLLGNYFGTPVQPTSLQPRTPSVTYQ
ncbi:MAG: hypothetical protein Q8Q11_00445 [bacterium]|nr:hypothetical protein [bacterium]MDZ4247812.1 hypothetical protein [Patescibacteria group bacterium]